ncbi:hypothetical protein PNH50_12885 [Leisingera aquaemixtae]|uniref:hypothetical protein n=1 Tax=Leisingera aquaemixtae TaxID=1396826 RepID=UPI0039843EC0
MAGFKLALIVISYFGLGSVAKWIISYWYPFTRWIWDYICDYLTFPHLPILIKDSLTALVFFLPLGVNALWQIRNGATEDFQKSHRILGGVFGVLFLVIICKDVFTSIASAVAALPQGFSDNYQPKIVQKVISLAEAVGQIPDAAVGIAFGAYASLVTIGLAYARKRYGVIPARQMLSRGFKLFYKTFSFAAISLSLLSGVATGMSLANGLGEHSTAILASLAILLTIMGLIGAAAAFSPKKLFLTTGAAIGFIFAAVLFETTVSAIRFIETIPKS